MEEDAKIFIIRLDGQDIAQIPIKSTNTVGQIKEYFKTYLRSQRKNPDDYIVKIYRDKVNKFDVDGTNKYDEVTMAAVWTQLSDPYIVLDYSPNYFNRLYTDVIYQIALRVDIKDLSNLCLTDKRLSQICGDDRFWTSRAIQDFGIVTKPSNMTWKEFYQRASIGDVDQLLFNSAKEGIVELVHVALARGASPNAIDDVSRNTALNLAALEGHLDVAILLVEKGADIHYLDQAALRYASLRGHSHIVRYLLDKGANVHARTDEALRWAAFTGHEQVVQLLLENGANVHASEDHALRVATDEGNVDVVRILLAYDADVHADNDEALMNAVRIGNTELINLLLDNGANINARHNNALSIARNKGNSEVINLLLERGARI